MLNKFFGWFDAFKVCFLCAIVWSTFNIYFIVQDYLHPAELKEFKGGIQNHLVWSNKGECFFVRPATGQAVYLIKVEDCNK